MSEPIEPRCMIDTNVLQYAIFGAVGYPGTRPDHRLLFDSSLDLVRRLKRIRISAITWSEINRNIRKPHFTVIREWQMRMIVVPVTEEIATLAAALLSVKTGQERTCPRCLNSLQTAPCKACNAVLPKSSHLADALILSTAEIRNDVEVLYSLDGGVKSYVDQGHVHNCVVRRPPNPNGPLFEQASEAEASP